MKIRNLVLYVIFLSLSVAVVYIHVPKKNTTVISDESTVEFFDKISDTYKICSKYEKSMPLNNSKRALVLKAGKDLDSYRETLVSKLAGNGDGYINDWLYHLRVHSDQVVSYCNLVAYVDNKRNIDVLRLTNSIEIKQSNLNELIIKLKRAMK